MPNSEVKFRVVIIQREACVQVWVGNRPQTGNLRHVGCVLGSRTSELLVVGD